MLYIIQAVILGIVEGITEFLPISSTGHLIVTQKLLGFKDQHDLYTVVIQLGAIAAVVWFYRQDLLEKTLGLFRKDTAALNFWKILIVGTIPAGVIGLLLDKSLEKFTTPLIVAVSLIVGAIVLWAVDNKPVASAEKADGVETISVKNALLVGLGQCVAMIPGISRSGATIVSGLAVGLNRPTATALSFYLSIPVLMLASAYKLAKYHAEIPNITGGYAALSVGLIVSFMTALAAVSWLLRYIAHHNFRPFAIYRFVAGLAILLLIWSNVL